EGGPQSFRSRPPCLLIVVEQAFEALVADAHPKRTVRPRHVNGVTGWFDGHGIAFRGKVADRAPARSEVATASASLFRAGQAKRTSRSLCGTSPTRCVERRAKWCA